MAERRCSRSGARGLVLVAVLLMLALLGVAALTAAEVWSMQRQREREEELLFVGDQYRRAIADYWRRSPGIRTLPPTIDALLVDDRFPTPAHHLRRAYKDPMTDSDDWNLILVNDRIAGVASKSAAATLKRAGFRKLYADFADAETVDQWKFIFVPPMPRGRPGALPAPGTNPGNPAPVNNTTSPSLGTSP